jgi:hypothetical protein
MKRPPQTPRKPLDYSKANEVQGKTREQLLSEGYTEQVKDGKTYFAKQSESSAPPSNNTPPVRPRMTKAPVTGNPKPVRRNPTPTPGTQTDTQEIVYINSAPPKSVGVNSDVSVRGEEKRNALGTNMYTISYPDTRGGGGMSKATTEIFNNDPSKGKIGAHISGFDANGNPIFSGKTQNDFTPQNQGSTSLMSNDVNKNSVDYQLSNSKQPIETTGNKYQEIGANDLNAPAIDKKDQGIGTGLMNIEELPSTELNKRPDVINTPKFNKGGGIYKMKRPPKYRKGGEIC